MSLPFLPFSRPTIGSAEVAEVVATLRSGWLTSGPRVSKFEEAFQAKIGCRYALAVSSATAALHLAYLAAGIGPGDEVITSPITFAATANMLVAVGAKPIFADVDPRTLNLTIEAVEKRRSARTKAIVLVHFAGLPCAIDAFKEYARRRKLLLIEDAAHAVGASYHGRPVGRDSDFACFSFHPNKNITTAEGGMLVTSKRSVYQMAKLARFHGIDKEAWRRMGPSGRPHFVQKTLGFKYNLTDLQAAIGLHQLTRLDGFNRRRSELAEEYLWRLRNIDEVERPATGDTPSDHAWHLFVIRFRDKKIGLSRDVLLDRLRDRGIGAGLHYTALHLQPYYQTTFGTKRGDCPVAEDASRRLASLPLFPTLSGQEVRRVVTALQQVVRRRR